MWTSSEASGSSRRMCGPRIGNRPSRSVGDSSRKRGASRASPNHCEGHAVTMLYSFYTAEGIVYAADSRITHKGGTLPLMAQRKVLPLPGFGVSNGVIGFFGLAQVGGQAMSDWLRDIIARYTALR